MDVDQPSKVSLTDYAPPVPHERPDGRRFNLPSLVRIFEVNGLLILTLGVGTIMYGLANWYTAGRQIVTTLPPAFLALNQAALLGIPLPAWYVAVFALVFWAVLEFLPIGRYLYAVGSNRRAAELVGVRTSRYVIGAFV